MPTATLAASLTYTPPGGGANSGTAALAVAASYNAQSVGTIDIPDTTAAGTIYAIPFGSINTDCKMMIIRNNGNQDVILRLNGVVANLYRIPPGGEFLAAHPVAAGGSPLLSAEIETTALQVGLGTVNYYVFGD